jgi:hypothetical protein
VATAIRGMARLGYQKDSHPKQKPPDGSRPRNVAAIPTAITKAGQIGLRSNSPPTGNGDIYSNNVKMATATTTFLKLRRGGRSKVRAFTISLGCRCTTTISPPSRNASTSTRQIRTSCMMR